MKRADAKPTKARARITEYPLKLSLVVGELAAATRIVVVIGNIINSNLLNFINIFSN